MMVLLNAVVSVLVLTAALVSTSLDRRTAMLLGSAGTLTGNFLTWITVPRTWEQSLLVPWVAGLVGTVALIAGWSAVRAYTGLFAPPDVDDVDEAELVSAGRD